MKDRPTTVYLNEKTQKLIRELADANNISFSSVVEAAVKMFSAELRYTDRRK